MWTQEYPELLTQICTLLPLTSAPALPKWESPLLGDDWNKLQNYIDETCKSIVIRSLLHLYRLTEYPIEYTLTDPRHNSIFPKNITKTSLQTLAEPLLSKHMGPIV